MVKCIRLSILHKCPGGTFIVPKFSIMSNSNQNISLFSVKQSNNSIHKSNPSTYLYFARKYYELCFLLRVKQLNFCSTRTKNDLPFLLLRNSKNCFQCNEIDCDNVPFVKVYFIFSNVIHHHSVLF